MIRTFALVLVFCSAAIGCVHQPGGVAASNIPLAPDGYTILGPASASDCKVNLLGILPISTGNKLAGAMAKALGDRPGTSALVNITVDTSSKYWVLWSNTCTEVNATAVSVR